MGDKSTTAGNDPQTGDATADSTTTQDSTTATDQQTADGDNLDSSKSTDGSSAGGDTTTTDGAKDDNSASTFDDDIDNWVEKRGLPKPEDDATKQKYQDLRNEQRAFTKEAQAKKDAQGLGDAVKDAKDATKSKDDDEDDDSTDPVEKRLAAVEADRDYERTTRQQSEFYATANEGKPVTPEEHTAILAIYKEKTGRPSTLEGKKAAVELWSKPEALADLHELAKARIANSADSTVIADEAAQKEREKIAQESHAKSTGRSSTTTSLQDKTAEQERTERLKERYSTPKKS